MMIIHRRLSAVALWLSSYNRGKTTKKIDRSFLFHRCYTIIYTFPVYVVTQLSNIYGIFKRIYLVGFNARLHFQYYF